MGLDKLKLARTLQVGKSWDSWERVEYSRYGLGQVETGLDKLELAGASSNGLRKSQKGQ